MDTKTRPVWLRALHLKTIWLFAREVRNIPPATNCITPFFQIVLFRKQFIACLFEFQLQLAIQLLLQIGMSGDTCQILHLVLIQLVIIHKLRPV
ncbi:MAG: hypothetical protein FVQ82_11620 [Planctomycetes bacterium]|nr:hypothetical protein [Planctomycetota bacterium]